jgi:hypothetical protein
VNIHQVMAEVGRLHMENIELQAENAELRAMLTAMAGPAPVAESESESDPRDPSAPSDGAPDQDG